MTSLVFNFKQLPAGVTLSQICCLVQISCLCFKDYFWGFLCLYDSAAEDGLRRFKPALMQLVSVFHEISLINVQIKLHSTRPRMQDFVMGMGKRIFEFRKGNGRN